MFQNTHSSAWLRRGILLTASALYVCSLGSGCAVMMAARAPEKRNLDVLQPGTSRAAVISELGQPVHTRMTQWGPLDIFAFKQGYSMPTRVTRSLAHGTADVATLGLWEVVATPLESTLQGEKVRVEVAYDSDQIVRRVEYFSGAHLANGRATLAEWMRTKSSQQAAVVGDAEYGVGSSRSLAPHSPADSPPEAAGIATGPEDSVRR